MIFRVSFFFCVSSAPAGRPRSRDQATTTTHAVTLIPKPVRFLLKLPPSSLMTLALVGSFLFGQDLSELSPGISSGSLPKMAAAHDSSNNDANNDIVSSFDSIPLETWDGVADSLRANGGVATIDFISPDICNVHAACFETARRGLDVAKRNRDGDTSSTTMKRIGPNDDSAHATGYHCAGSDGPSMSRYNSYREGFVFSDGNIFNVDLGEKDNERRRGGIFQSDMETFFASMHDAIAVKVLRAIARNLGCEDEDWFQTNLGPTDESSQWHVKRYVCPTATGSEKNQNSECDDNRDVEDDIEWLPVHTDPSLISIVLHDVPGKREGAMGLQYQVPDPSTSDSNPKSLKKIWVDVPWHGHAVATVFVGSVLSYITGNLYPGAKHRVVYRPSTTSNGDESERVAATLFVRPRGDCKLLVPPSPLFLTAEGNSSVRIRNTTFDVWLARVSRNYMKGRKKNDKSK